MNQVMSNSNWFSILLMVVCLMVVEEGEAKTLVYSPGEPIVTEMGGENYKQAVNGRLVLSVIQYFSPSIHSRHSLITKGVKGQRLFIDSGGPRKLCWAARMVGKELGDTQWIGGIDKANFHHFVIVQNDRFSLADAVAVTEGMNNRLSQQFTDDCTVQL